MVESEETITYVLDTMGELLTFPNCTTELVEGVETEVCNPFTIRGIPGTLVYNVQNFESPYDIEKQDVTFQISKTDCYANSLARGMEFNYTLSETTYTFEVVDLIDDLIGWVEVKAILTNRT